MNWLGVGFDRLITRNRQSHCGQGLDYPNSMIERAELGRSLNHLTGSPMQRAEYAVPREEVGINHEVLKDWL